MPGWLKKLAALGGRGRRQPMTPEESRALAQAFKNRYLEFRGLLAANNQALEQMAVISLALSQGRALGLDALKAAATGVGVKAFVMARHLEALAPGKYSALFERLDAIGGAINHALEAPGRAGQGRLVLPVEDIGLADREEAGPKMANLAEAAKLGLKVPPGFVITASAWRLFMAQDGLGEEIDRRVRSHWENGGRPRFELASALQQKIVKARLPEVLEEAITQAFEGLLVKAGPGARVAMRSSALGEDQARSSFAGQYKTMLNVSREFLAQSYKEVVASKYSLRAMEHRRLHGLADQEVPICVGCLAMVEARAGGVAYTANPLNAADRDLRISAAWGLPKAVVDGDAPADQLVVDREPPHRIISRRIAHKDTMLQCRPDEGACRVATPGEKSDAPVLDQARAAELAGAALELEKRFGGIQDVEWALDQEGGLIILQSRPLFASEVSKPPLVALPEASALFLAGEAVSQGVGAGRVFWVRKEADLLRFPERGVLVVEHPWPRWASLLGHCSAVVAMTGGLAGHMATVAREMGVPALFGVGKLALGLEDGQKVTVDAVRGAIYPGLANIPPRPAPEAPLPDSPARARMKKTARHITPLSLPRPESPDFIAENCRTLHDVTRFCHEKSVAEMFAFGESHDFPQAAAKQLFYKVPMQYWVLNLGDGFKREVTGKYIELDDIASEPLLAVWEGMVAAPWDGPPAITMRGLASVMFQATANPALANPARQPYAERNYFMISRQFLNLQSRFGFHLAWVEALMSERPPENYLSFSFSGGAADSARKESRAKLIGDLLSARGFWVDVIGDTLRARLEGLDRAAIRREAVACGYLLMHTRQLDMAMGDPGQATHYRNKLATGLERLEGANRQDKAD